MQNTASLVDGLHACLVRSERLEKDVLRTYRQVCETDWRVNLKGLRVNLIDWIVNLRGLRELYVTYLNVYKVQETEESHLQEEKTRLEDLTD